MREWQPIETAPKDGSIVLGFKPNGYDDGYTIAEMRWEDDGYPLPGWYMTLRWGGDDSNSIEPTHWMPRPMPPNG